MQTCERKVSIYKNVDELEERYQRREKKNAKGKKAKKRKKKKYGIEMRRKIG